MMGQTKVMECHSFSSGVYTTAHLSSQMKTQLCFYFRTIRRQITLQSTGVQPVVTSLAWKSRQSYNKTAKTSEGQTTTKEAMLNKDFRQAINFAFNRHSYAARLNDEDGAGQDYSCDPSSVNFVQSGGKNFGDISSSRIG